MANYAKNPAGPVYLTLGDAGNKEGLSTQFVDKLNPLKGGAPVCAINTPPTYLSALYPASCLPFAPSYQPSSVANGAAGYLPSPANSSLFYCQSAQPNWSAYRDPSFGFGGITFVNDSVATFSWYRNGAFLTSSIFSRQ